MDYYIIIHFIQNDSFVLEDSECTLEHHNKNALEKQLIFFSWVSI